MRTALLLALYLTLLGGCDRVFGLTNSNLTDDVPSDAIVGDDLIAWYPMERVGADRVMRDESGRGNHLSCLGDCPIATEGVVDGALLFDGTQGLLGEQLSNLEMPSAYTIAVWMRVDGDSPEPNCPVSKALTQGGPSNTWQLCVHNGVVHSWSSDGSYLLSRRLLARDTWYHLAVRWDGRAPRDERLRELFIDGELESQMLTPDVVFGDGPLGVGADFDPMPIGQVTGAIDDVRIYDRSLSLTELGMLHDLGR